jgi:hypothetical protein
VDQDRVPGQECLGSAQNGRRKHSPRRPAEHRLLETPGNRGEPQEATHETNVEKRQSAARRRRASSRDRSPRTRKPRTVWRALPTGPAARAARLWSKVPLARNPTSGRYLASIGRLPMVGPSPGWSRRCGTGSFAKTTLIRRRRRALFSISVPGSAGAMERVTA